MSWFKLTIITLVVGLFSALSYGAENKPNIIIFYVDDLGWQDVQLNDLDEPCPYETPNMVKLAASGMNFTQGYSSAPTCSPSRAGIITGRHPAKIGITHVYLGAITKGKKDQQWISPYLDGHLNLDYLTLADALKQNGYRTGHVGKWHVGLTAANYGFDFVDQDRGIHRAMGDRTKDFATVDDGKYPLSKEKYFPYSQKKPDGISYPYDQLTESALQFMEESKSEPFFLNMCHWMVHWPVLTRNGELLEYYCDKMGQPFPPKPGDMKLKGQQNPYFAAMVTSVDWSLGRVLDFLKKTDDPRNPGKKLIDTTYLFFTADNGGAEIRGREIISDNYPLKYGKKHAEEGGIRVPMVIVGPGIPAASQFDEPVSQLDYFPTILNLTQSTIAPKDRQELNGLDISSVLMGRSDKVVDAHGVERKNLFWHYPHGNMKSAIREGDYKLYKQYQTDDFELYRLYKEGKRLDLEEANNLANDPEYAPVVKRLSADLETQLHAVHAEGPYLNPAYAQKEALSALIETSTFEPSTRQASLSLKKGGAAVREAFVVYCSVPGSKEAAHGKHGVVNEQAPQLRVKLPARIGANGYSVSASIPEGVPAYYFILIDVNNFQTYGDVQLAK